MGRKERACGRPVGGSESPANREGLEGLAVLWEVFDTLEDERDVGDGFAVFGDGDFALTDLRDDAGDFLGDDAGDRLGLVDGEDLLDFAVLDDREGVVLFEKDRACGGLRTVGGISAEDGKFPANAVCNSTRRRAEGMASKLANACDDIVA